MTYSEISRILGRHLAAVGYATVFDNREPETAPNGVFLAPVLLPDAAAKTDFCGKERRSGLYSINIYAPPDEGAGAALEAADRIVAHFDGASLKTLQCQTPAFARVGKSGDFFVNNVSVPWHVFS